MLKIGIIGAGRMGSTHTANLKSVAGTEVTAVYDVDQGKIDAFVKETPRAKAYPNALALAQSADVDFVLIASPTHCHIEGIKAVMTTAKPIFCEKPLCRTAEQLAELAPLITNYPNLFAIGFVRRYSAGVVKMRELLQAGKIGKMLCFEVHVMLGGFRRMPGDWFADYALSGGATLDMLAHHADLVNHLVGEPEAIAANALMLNPANGLPADYIGASVRCRNGVVGTMQSSWLRCGPNGTSMTVYGTEGALRLSDQAGLTFYTPGKEEAVALDEKTVTDVHGLKGGTYGQEMAVLVDCVLNHKKPWAGAAEAIASQTFCLAMMKSAETGKMVTL